MSEGTEPSYVVIDNIKCYAPELGSGNSDFPPESYPALYRSEAGSFWFRSRQRILEHLICQHFGNRTAKFLEIGCGTGFVLNGLSKFKNLHLTGAELNLAGLKWAAKRLDGVELVQLDATRLPYVEAFDGIGVFDVLEHIENDVIVLKQIHAALKVNGLLFLTVPQHPSLWSQTDVVAMHKRRYSRKELVQKVSQAGLEVSFISSFVFSLFPAMYLSRVKNRFMKKRSGMDDSELHLPPWLDAMGDFVMRADERLIFSGRSLPWGGSLVVVAKKRGAT